MSQKFGAISLLLALIVMPLSIILLLLVWSSLEYVWIISGVLAIIVGIVGLNKDDPTTISIIGIIFGIFSVLVYIALIVLVYSILY